MMCRAIKFLYLFSDAVAWLLAAYCAVCAVAVPLVAAPAYAAIRHRPLSVFEMAYMFGVFAIFAVLFWLVTKRKVIPAFIVTAVLSFQLVDATAKGYFGFMFFVLLALVLAILLPAVLSVIARRIRGGAGGAT